MRRKRRQACLAVLRQTFGISGFRPGQKAAVNALLSGRDVLCILPTGAGKSLCWQLPAVMQRGLTVVVSPLIALMDDQVQSLRRRGVPAETLNSLMTAQERQDVVRQVRDGRVRILLVSPERLETQAFQQLCQACPPWLVVVDEAHCVVQWGDEFRPVYARIGDFVRSLPDRPVICAMTATADSRMQRQIVRSLGMAFHKRVMLPVLRENLTYDVRTTARPLQAILQLMAQEPVKTVVFCRSRRHTELLAAALEAAGLAAGYYHAGLDRAGRERQQERFRTGETQILTATTAFGMGVDIPDVRRVIHADLPDSITDLVQQSGRAGRDGRPARCVILLTPDNLLHTAEAFREMRGAAMLRPLLYLRFHRRVWRPAQELLNLLATQECITAGISAAFGQLAAPCGRCSACLRGPAAMAVPDLMRTDEYGLRLWLLRLQRDALAKRRGVAAHALIGDVALMHIARELAMPEIADGEVRSALERLLTVFRGQAVRKAHAEKTGSAS